MCKIETDSGQPVLPVRSVGGGGREDGMRPPYYVILGICWAHIKT